MQARAWPQNVRIESSGYITVIDMEKAEEVLKSKPKMKKPFVEEETKTDPDTIKFKEFFEELVPFEGITKHIYSV